MGGGGSKQLLDYEEAAGDLMNRGWERCILWCACLCLCLCLCVCVCLSVPHYSLSGLIVSFFFVRRCLCVYVCVCAGLVSMVVFCCFVVLLMFVSVVADVAGRLPSVMGFVLRLVLRVFWLLLCCCCAWCTLAYFAVHSMFCFMSPVQWGGFCFRRVRLPAYCTSYAGCLQFTVDSKRLEHAILVAIMFPFLGVVAGGWSCSDVLAATQTRGISRQELLRGSRCPNVDVLGPKYCTFQGFWDLVS